MPPADPGRGARKPAIRLAEPGDLAAIQAIVERAYTPYIARMGRKPGPMLDDYGGLIAAGRVNVATIEGVAAGFIVLVPEGRTLLLDNVAIDPGHRGTGLGRRLLSFAEETARAKGCSRIRLYTHQTMTENVALYTRLGYRETHRASERGFARIFMAKDLA
ncbi:GNAT family N-acetyltransferase [Pararhizobium mangrovi]|uniref:GNAT family N-acetyltransferase n=1 Tax=Pararhizobium mangrovi TaxID=2590452 RepID=A0A506U1X5_9HYPH|nr:GNAT family N-acetyltransferase [Pararhizobium mangrovi]TPW27034.1 GNAT family N-acetyltransferase [Pararhizobium mangrovi]